MHKELTTREMVTIERVTRTLSDHVDGSFVWKYAKLAAEGSEGERNYHLTGAVVIIPRFPGPGDYRAPSKWAVLVALLAGGPVPQAVYLPKPNRITARGCGGFLRISAVATFRGAVERLEVSAVPESGVQDVPFNTEADVELVSTRFAYGS